LVTTTYPAHREATVVLRDGSTLAVRPIRPEDERELARFFTDLSMESRVFRFFAAISNADALAKQLVAVNYTTRYGILAVAGAERRLVGHAMYVETGHSLWRTSIRAADWARSCSDNSVRLRPQ